MSNKLNNCLKRYISDCAEKDRAEFITIDSLTKYAKLCHPEIESLSDAFVRRKASKAFRNFTRQSTNPKAHSAARPPNASPLNDVLRKTYSAASLRNANQAPAAKRSKIDFSEHVVFSSVSFSDIGGYKSVVQELKELVVLPICHPEVYKGLGGRPPKSFLLVGPTGAGKTLFATAVATECCATLLRFSAAEILADNKGSSIIKAIFDEANKNSPCVVLIEEIDLLCGTDPKSALSNAQSHNSKLLSALDELCRQENSVFVIGTTTSSELMSKPARRGGRFDREIELKLPSLAERREILGKLTEGAAVGAGVDLGAIAAKTAGYVGSDLLALVREATKAAAKKAFGSLESERLRRIEGLSLARGDDADSAIVIDAASPGAVPGAAGKVDFCKIGGVFELKTADFEQAVEKVVPSFRKEGFTPAPKTSWDEIGGLDALHAEMKMAVVLPIKYPALFRRQGLEQPCGVLLFGPPGCGKTLVAKAIANETQASFISVKGPELLNSLVGETERSIRLLFKRASTCAPCVVFFDEIESLVPKRGGFQNSSEVSLRVVTQLLTELDGLDERLGVFVVAATNRPDLIDGALLRPGRLGRSIYIPLPTEAQRLQIFEKHLRKIPRAANDDLAAYLANRTPGFSGADCAGLVRKASTRALAEFFVMAEKGDMANGPGGSFGWECEKGVDVTQEHFDAALSDTHRSVSEKSEEMYAKMQNFNKS